MPNENDFGLAAAMKRVEDLAVSGNVPRKVAYYPLEADHAGTEIPFVVIPNGHQVHSLRDQIFHPHRPRPTSVETVQKMKSADSFIRYFNRFKDPASTIFANPEKLAFAAVLDYHESPSLPRWGRHQVTYDVQVSDEWKVWIGKNRKPFNQYEFAEFVEENSLDFVDAATMVEVARNLYATKSATYRGATNLKNGSASISYTEDVNGGIRNSTMEIPGSFEIDIPVFKGENPMRMTVRFRYRLNDGELTLYYLLNKPERVIDQKFAELAVHIEDSTGVLPYLQ